MSLKEVLEKNKDTYIEFYVHGGGRDYWTDKDSLNEAISCLNVKLEKYLTCPYTRYSNFPFLHPQLKEEEGEELLKRIEEIQDVEKRKLLKFLFKSNIFSYSPFEQLLYEFHDKTGKYTWDKTDKREIPHLNNIHENYKIELIELPDKIAKITDKKYILKITFPPKKEICDMIGRTNIYYFALMVNDKSLFNKLYEIYTKEEEIQDALLEIVEYFIPKESPAYKIVKLMKDLPNYKPLFIEIKKDGKLTIKDPFETLNLLKYKDISNHIEWADEEYKIKKKEETIYDERTMEAWKRLHKKPEHDDLLPKSFSKRKRRKRKK